MDAGTFLPSQPCEALELHSRFVNASLGAVRLKTVLYMRQTGARHEPSTVAEKRLADNHFDTVVAPSACACRHARVSRTAFTICAAAA